MENLKLQTEVDIKCFGGKVTVEKNIGGTDSAKRYVYKITHKGQSYILKGFKIHLEHLNPGNEKSVDMFKEGIEEIGQVYQEYCFARAACVFNAHFVKPLFLDYTIKVASTRSSYTYMYIEIIFEDGGVSLNKLESVSIDDIYKLMRQSADALVLLHDIGIAHFDIKPENMVYEKKGDILKVIDMGSAFGSATRSKITGTTVTFDGKIRSGTLEFAPPEVLRMVKRLERVPGIEITIGSVDVYCWAMCFYSIIKRRSADDLVNDYRKYKLESEINYKDYIEIVREDLDSIKTKNFAEKDKIDFIKKLLTNSLKYRPKDRPTMKIILNDMKEFEKIHNTKVVADSENQMREEDQATAREGKEGKEENEKEEKETEETKQAKDINLLVQKSAKLSEVGKKYLEKFKQLNKYIADKDKMTKYAEKKFAETDTDNSGELSPEEFKDFVAKLLSNKGLPPPSDRRIKSMMRRYDKSGSGTLYKCEFQNMLLEIFLESRELLIINYAKNKADSWKPAKVPEKKDTSKVRELDNLLMNSDEFYAVLEDIAKKADKNQNNMLDIRESTELVKMFCERYRLPVLTCYDIIEVMHDMERDVTEYDIYDLRMVAYAIVSISRNLLK